MVFDLYSFEGEKTGTFSFKSKELDWISVNTNVIYEAIKNQLSNKRQGTASCKTRSLIRGSTKKPWRQKGTGRARAGSRNSPLWRGGGVIFGPHPRDYSYRIPKKVRRSAFISVLNHHLQKKTLIGLEDFDCKEYNTKKIAALLRQLTEQKRVLFVLNAENKESTLYLHRSSSKHWLGAGGERICFGTQRLVLCKTGGGHAFFFGGDE